MSEFQTKLNSVPSGGFLTPVRHSSLLIHRLTMPIIIYVL